MKLAEKVQKDLKASDYKMAKDMQLGDATAWIKFRESKASYLMRLYRLYELSGYSAKDFTELFKA